MQESGGIYVSEPKEAIIVPTKLKELTGDFTNTFVALLGWKVNYTFEHSVLFTEGCVNSVTC